MSERNATRRGRRLPRRGTDLAEDITVWVLIALGMLFVVAEVAAGAVDRHGVRVAAPVDLVKEGRSWSYGHGTS